MDQQFDKEEVNHKPFLDTEIWATVHCGVMKFFGRLCETEYNNGTASLGAQIALQDFLKGKQSFDFSPLFEYQIEQIPCTSDGKALTETELLALKRQNLPPPSLARQPQFFPFDFTTGPAAIRCDLLQICNLLNEDGRKTYERVIYRALRQHKLTRANDSGIVAASSLAEVRQPPPGQKR
jgi:hypothetical protein